MPALLDPRPSPTLPPGEFQRAVIFGVVPCANDWCEDGIEWPAVDDLDGPQIQEAETCTVCGGTGVVAGDRR